MSRFPLNAPGRVRDWVSVGNAMTEYSSNSVTCNIFFNIKCSFITLMPFLMCINKLWYFKQAED